MMSFKATDGQACRGILHGRSRIVKLSISLLAVVSVLTLVAVGCATKKPPASASASALDVGPNQPAPAMSSTPAYTAAPVYTPPPTPVYAPPPAPTASEWATVGQVSVPDKVVKRSSSVDSSAGKTYTVIKGDTLYKIAKDHYGDTKMVSKIEAANPGMEPSKLKIGQKIVLP
jgi:5'-nucleotidase